MWKRIPYLSLKYYSKFNKGELVFHDNMTNQANLQTELPVLTEDAENNEDLKNIYIKYDII